MNNEAQLEFAKNLALEAGKIMRKYFRSSILEVSRKKDNTPVTQADIKINELVIKEVKKAYPEYGILGEEISYKPEREMVWIVDPLDGTIPFTLGMPTSTFLLALVDRKDGQPIVAVVYDPYLKKMYTAIKHQGAYLNDQPIKTNPTKSMEKGYVSTYPSSYMSDKVDYSPGKMWDDIRSKGVRNILLSSGAYTGSKVASGEFLAFMGGPSHPWDVASLALLIQEAGGVITDLEGNKRRFDAFGEKGHIMSANKKIHDTLLSYIKVTK
jgi:myo-inositol-1(or 4)-monophosphatase